MLNLLRQLREYKSIKNQLIELEQLQARITSATHMLEEIDKCYTDAHLPDKKSTFYGIIVRTTCELDTGCDPQKYGILETRERNLKQLGIDGAALIEAHMRTVGWAVLGFVVVALIVTLVLALVALAGSDAALPIHTIAAYCGFGLSFYSFTKIKFTWWVMIWPVP